MKKVIKLLSVCLLSFGLVGCNKEVVKEIELKTSNVTYTVNGKNGNYYTKDAVETILENANPIVSEVLNKALYEAFDIDNNESNKKEYERRIKNEFKTLMENSDYKVGDLFDEELLVAKLRTDMYVITKDPSGGVGVTKDLGLTYDYSDYINRYLKTKVFTDMAKEEYIFNKEKELLDSMSIRVIRIYETNNLSEMEEILEKLNAGNYDLFESIELELKNKAKEEIKRSACDNLGYKYPGFDNNGTECAPSSNRETYSQNLYKYTTCENGRKCSVEDGVEYLLNEEDKKEYINRKVITSTTDTSSILFPAAINQLLRSDVSKYLKEIEFSSGEKSKFLVSPVNNFEADNSISTLKDIVLTNTLPSSSTLNDATKRYLVEVIIVDSTTSRDKIDRDVLDLVMNEIGQSIFPTVAIQEMIKDVEITINDKTIEEYLDAYISK